MSNFVAIYDACVFYPAPVRDFLIRLARTNLFRARWTNQIHDEWIAALLRNRPDLTSEQLARTRARANDAVPDCLVTGYEGLINGLNLPDANDRHVLAAAIRCQAGVIVTTNIRDFPPEALQPYGLEAQHPDDFINYLFDLSPTSPAKVCVAVKEQRLALKNPPQNIDQLLTTFQQHGLTTTVESLSTMTELL